MDLTAFAQEARSIAAKRSHVKQSFDELIERMSEFVADVEDGLPPIYSDALSTEEENEGYAKYDLVLAYISRDDASFRLRTLSYIWHNGQWEYEDWHGYASPSVREIREIAPKLPQALEQILAKLRERGEEADQAQKAIGELLEKLR